LFGSEEIGDLLGRLIGVQANVGGVGIAMLLLIFLSNLHDHGLKMSVPTETGINFWSAMYIPIVVAMAAKQNVIAALSSGWMAITAGIAAVVASFLLIPVMARISHGGNRDS
jgi:malonate transporter MadL subunit